MAAVGSKQKKGSAGEGEEQQGTGQSARPSAEEESVIADERRKSVLSVNGEW